MKSIFTCLFLFVAISLQAQEEINFNSNSSWAEAREKSVKEHKLIFIDCYTSWCGPCKWMEKNVFIQPAVYNYYNTNFINLKLDMEKGEGIEMKKKYNVQSYPTYLFVNDKGEIIHRTASRMTAEEFLAEAKLASDPKKNSAALKAKYDNGTRDLPFLMDYYLVLKKSDRGASEKIGTEVTDKVQESDLGTALGWKIINNLARAKDDKLGAWFMQHKDKITSYSTAKERDALTDRLISNSLYGKMRSGDEKGFFSELQHFKASPDVNRQKQGIMLEADYYQEQKNVAAYNKLTSAALNGLLKDDAEKLSFLARRADMKGDGNAALLPQAYLMAKRAMELEPEEYSTVSTFSRVCLSMKRKEEGLIAAKKARQLADAETSKIQKLAQNVIDELNQL